MTDIRAVPKARRLLLGIVLALGAAMLAPMAASAAVHHGKPPHHLHFRKAPHHSIDFAKPVHHARRPVKWTFHR